MAGSDVDFVRQPDRPQWKRVILKLSGEALAEPTGFGLDTNVLRQVGKGPALVVLLVDIFKGTAAVRLNNVSKIFGTGEEQTRALDDVSLELPYGEMVLLVGPSGCGKTTLISCVAGLLDPTAGEVEVLGRNITKMWGGTKVKFRGTASRTAP